MTKITPTMAAAAAQQMATENRVVLAQLATGMSDIRSFLENMSAPVVDTIKPPPTIETGPIETRKNAAHPKHGYKEEVTENTTTYEFSLSTMKDKGNQIIIVKTICSDGTKVRDDWMKTNTIRAIAENPKRFLACATKFLEIAEARFDANKTRKPAASKIESEETF